MIHECFLDLELPAITGSSVGKEKQEWEKGSEVHLAQGWGQWRKNNLKGAGTGGHG